MQPVKNPMPQIKNKILVMSGKGGVGKSTVSVNLAYALALTGKRVGIMDVDIHGPSIPKMTGIENQKIVTGEDQIIHPIEVVTNIFVMSIASLLPGKDEAVIWRGPMKNTLIKQFIEEVKWPELDYLVVDCPPGTGDEPLSVIQMIGKIDGVVIVSTPQDVAFLDARKSVSFCNQLKTPILGIVENMSGFICPNCSHYIDIFKAGGAERTAKDFNLEILGKIPLDSGIVESGDDGKPFVYFHKEGNPAGEVFLSIAEKVANKMNKGEIKMSKRIIAVPADNNGFLAEHFGHCEKFAFYHIENNQIVRTELLTPPAHAEGVIPKWVGDNKANIVLAGGMGKKAKDLFAVVGVEVLTGVEYAAAEEIVKSYLNNTLMCSGAVCNHNHDHGADHNCSQ